MFLTYLGRRDDSHVEICSGWHLARDAAAKVAREVGKWRVEEGGEARARSRGKRGQREVGARGAGGNAIIHERTAQVHPEPRNTQVLYHIWASPSSSRTSAAASPM